MWGFKLLLPVSSVNCFVLYFYCSHCHSYTLFVCLYQLEILEPIDIPNYVNIEQYMVS